MKTFKLIFTVILVAIVTFAQAQKNFKVTDILDGKTILQHAKIIDAEALLQSNTIYSNGMTEATFVSELQKSFPPEARSYKQLFTPYFQYVYSLHKKGMTEAQVRGTTSGIELASLFTDLNAFNFENPGVIPQATESLWRGIRKIIDDIIRALGGTVYM